MTSRVPSTLAPYVAVPPRDTLTLVTSVLGASANWVILRYSYSVLYDGKDKRGVRAARFASSDQVEQAQAATASEDTAVVLVSWMRDWEFWRSEARRAMGLDLARLQLEGHFAFVDGLTSLFSLPDEEGSHAPTSQSGSTSIPMRGTAPSKRPPISSTTLSTAASPTETSGKPSFSSPTLTDPTLKTLLSSLLTTISSLSAQRVLVILDTPTILLTATPAITSASLTQALLHIRSLPSVHATIMHLPADGPFLSAAAEALRTAANEEDSTVGTQGHTPLDIETSSFVVGMAHQARLVLGVRRLGTGWAGDVSGVVRITRGGAVDASDGSAEADPSGNVEDVEEGEWLYHVAGDGGVRVWARGADMS